MKRYFDEIIYSNLHREVEGNVPTNVSTND